MVAVSACSVRAVRVEFMTRLYFLYARNPTDALEAIERQKEALHEHIERLKERLKAMVAHLFFNFMGMSLRIHQLETLVEFLNDCNPEIRSTI